MNPREYEVLAEIEDQFWWHRALHLRLRQILAQNEVSSPGTALDVGCGAGGWMSKLQQDGWRVSGVDMASDAVEFCRQRGHQNVFTGSANKLAFDADTFDLVTCIDVLECESAEPELAMSEMRRVLRMGGSILLVVPAFQWLLSEHDQAVHSVRRYTRSGLKTLAKRTGLTIRSSSYFFSLLFPIMAAAKLLSRPRPDRSVATSHVKMPPPWLNVLLYRFCRLEIGLVGKMLPPIGTSIIALLSKNE